MGAFDPWALDVVAALTKEVPATALECVGRTAFETDGGTVVVVGSGASLVTETATIHAPCIAQVGGRFTIVPRVRALVATPGGWIPPLPFGAANCQKVVPGSKLVAVSPRALPSLQLDTRANGSLESPLVLRVIGEVPPGPWTVQLDSDRRGVRFRNPRVVQGPAGLVPSRPCFVGTCQLTPDGTLIVHGPDGPTLGGYHQAGTLTAAHLHHLAQLRPGDQVYFRNVSVEEALQARRMQREELTRWQRWIDSNR